MEKEYIGVLDSGIGGLSLLRELVKAFPKENYIYYGDNKNAPYGNKTVRELKYRVFTILNELNDFNIKCIVFACNTLSINLINKLNDITDIPIIGIFPPIEYYVLRDKKTLLLCTPLTASKINKQKNLTVLPLKNLAFDIENNCFNLEKVDVKKQILEAFKSNNIDISSKYDVLILGCTHYVFVKNKIFDHFVTQKTTDGAIFTINKVKAIIKTHKNISKNKGFSVIFCGDDKIKNEKFWNKINVNNNKI